MNNLIDMIEPTPIWKLQLPIGVESYAYDFFREELDQLCYPDIIVLPLTPEGETELEYLSNYQYDENGNMIHQSIYRYGASINNFNYNGETYISILINND